MKKSKIIGVVIVYNFDIEDLITNLNQYLFRLDKLIIWQNSILSKVEKDKIEKIKHSNKIKFCGTGENMGISYPLNQIIKSYKNKYDYLLTMDQDSIWVNFNEYINSLLEIETEKKLYIYGPKVVTNKTSSTETKYSIKNETVVDHVITSGAVYNMKMFDMIGGFNETYFIDAIDEEICYRANNYGINSLKINNAILVQTYGKPHTYNFFGKEIIYNKYSSQRMYYIVRNHIALVRNYKISYKKKLFILYIYVVRPIFMIVFFDDEKIIKMKSIIKGVRDGIQL